MKMELELRILTLNCWGIPWISYDRKARMVAIATELANGNYDFVVLQEVWSKQDFEMIVRKTHTVLPYSFYFHSGVIGAGLCVFSKGQIIDTLFQRWPLNGYVHKIQHGDWFGGKGVGLCRIFYHGLYINLYTAHLHAEYNRKHDEYLSHRICQAFEFSQFVSNTSANCDLVIVAGDFNAEPVDLPYRLLRYNSCLLDSFLEINKITEDDIGATNETARNTYTPKNVLKQCPLGKRIDYVLYAYRQGTEVVVKSCNCPLDKVPEAAFSYSDHEAVSAVILVTKTVSAVNEVQVNVSERIAVLEEAVSIIQRDIKRLVWDKILYFVVFFILFCLLFGTVHVQLAYNLQGLLGFLRILLTMMMTFCILMATLWNKIEHNSLMAAQQSMNIILFSLRKDEVLSGGDICIPNDIIY